jgi:ABC-type nitrate/sulfonate/bicarbonate transport system substrate-binding protein
VEPFIEPPLRAGKAKLLARQYLAVSNDTVVATYAVTREWLRRNDDVAQRFRRSFLRADDFIRQDGAKARDIIGGYSRIARSDLHVIGMPAFEASVRPAPIQELLGAMGEVRFLDRNVRWQTLLATPK